MTNEQPKTLVVKDEAGSYFLLPLETLEQGRVPEAHKTTVERLIAGQQEVQGHMLHALLVPAAVITTGIVLVAQELTKDEPSTMTNAQFVEQITGRPFGR